MMMKKRCLGNLWRQGAALALVLSVQPLCAATPAANCQPTLHDLGAAGGSASFATAMNAQGTVVGAVQTAAGQRPARSEGNRLIDISSQLVGPASAGRYLATAINDQGDVAGMADSPWWWTAGEPQGQQMATPPFCSGGLFPASVPGIARDGALVSLSSGCSTEVGRLFAHAHPQAGQYLPAPLTDVLAYPSLAPRMNARGDTMWTVHINHSSCSQGMLSRRQSDGSFAPAAFQGLDDGQRTCSELGGLNDRGWLAGTALQGAPFQLARLQQGFVRDTRSGVLLTLPSPLAADGASWGQGISANGRWVAGAASATADGLSPRAATRFRLHGGLSGRYVGEVLPLDLPVPVAESWAQQVTDQGQVLGIARGTDFVRHVFVQRGHRPAVRLVDLFPSLQDIEETLIQNEAGQIAGTAIIAGQRHAFRVDCPTGY